MLLAGAAANGVRALRSLYPCGAGRVAYRRVVLWWLA
jgi:hypothetical protein